MKPGTRLRAILAGDIPVPRHRLVGRRREARQLLDLQARVEARVEALEDVLREPDFLWRLT